MSPKRRRCATFTTSTLAAQPFARIGFCSADGNWGISAKVEQLRKHELRQERSYRLSRAVRLDTIAASNLTTGKHRSRRSSPTYVHLSPGVLLPRQEEHQRTLAEPMAVVLSAGYSLNGISDHHRYLGGTR